MAWEGNMDTIIRAAQPKHLSANDRRGPEKRQGSTRFLMLIPIAGCEIMLGPPLSDDRARALRVRRAFGSLCWPLIPCGKEPLR